MVPAQRARLDTPARRGMVGACVRNISFALTTQQVRNQTKTVTRRLGWKDLKPGTVLQPVVKGMGLKKGERVEKIGGPIRVVSTRREPLGNVAFDDEDVRLEGFPQFDGPQFLALFCQHNRCTPDTEVTRIEFEYVN